MMKKPWLFHVALVIFCLAWLGSSLPQEKGKPQEENSQQEKLADLLVGKWYITYQDTEGAHYGVFDITYNKRVVKHGDNGYFGSYIIYKKGVRYEEDPWKNTKSRDYIVNGVLMRTSLKSWDGKTLHTNFGDGGAGIELKLNLVEGGKVLEGTWQYDWGKWPKRKPQRLVEEGKEGLMFELFDKLYHPERWSRTPPTDDAEKKAWEESVKTWEKKVDATKAALKKQDEMLEKAWAETSEEKQKKILEFAKRAHKTQQELPKLVEEVKKGDNKTASTLVAKTKEQLEEILAINKELPEAQRLDAKTIKEALELVTRLEGGLGLAKDAKLLSKEAKGTFDKLTKTMNVLLNTAMLNRSKSMEEKLGALGNLFSEFVPAAAALPMVVTQDILVWDGKMADTYLFGMGILGKTIEGEDASGDFERLNQMVDDVRKGPFNKETFTSVAKKTIEKIPVISSIVKLFWP